MKFISYEDFVKSQTAVRDLGEALQEETLKGQIGLVYLGNYYIATREKRVTGQRYVTEYWLMLGRCEYQGSLEDMRSRLYLYVAGEEGWDEC